MTNRDILIRIKNYFFIYELVGKEVYDQYGEDAWKFLDTRLLHALLIIREGLGRKIIINNWKSGKELDERGLRTNLQPLFRKKFAARILYLSGHVLGKAVDFDVEGMTAEEVRKWIVENAELFPFSIRLEAGKSWVHLDVIFDISKPKIYLFKV